MQLLVPTHAGDRSGRDHDALLLSVRPIHHDPIEDVMAQNEHLNPEGPYSKVHTEFLIVIGVLVFVSWFCRDCSCQHTATTGDEKPIYTHGLD